MEVRLVILMVFFISIGFILSLGANKNFKDKLNGPSVNQVISDYRKKQAAPKVAQAEAVKAPAMDPGKMVYTKKGKCLTCHGSDAMGKASQQAPRLAGQHAWYIFTSLKDFKSGERKNTKMLPYIKKLTEEDFQAVAKYLSGLKQ